MKLYTIGHGNHSLTKFINLLEVYNIMVLVDVRSTPYSRFNPQFNKENLKRNLPEYWMEYVFAGQYLGGRPSDPSCYKNKALPTDDDDYLHTVDYPTVMTKIWFIQGVQRLIELANEQTTAIMCSEEDPAKCHRHHLIAAYIHDNYPDIEVLHIRGDENVYNARSVHQSLDKPSADQLSLF